MSTDVQRLVFSELRLQNILSFGPQEVTLPMRSLNVLIGPNGSGKSNLVEVIELLHAAPTDITQPIRDLIGLRELCWKPGSPALSVATVLATSPRESIGDVIRHHLRLAVSLPSAFDVIELIGIAGDSKELVLLVDLLGVRPSIRIDDGGVVTMRTFDEQELDGRRSVLSQLKGPSYPELTALGRLYESIRIYRQIHFGPDSILRKPCSEDLPDTDLATDFTNFPARLNKLLGDDAFRARMGECLEEFSAAFSEVVVKPEAGQLRIWMVEKNGIETPSSRLSDGTLRFLVLVSLLIDPKPPPLIVIEEPETGLHPDLVSFVAKLLVEASGRGQIVVTTHSEMLVSALSETPESIVVCEKHEGSTQMKRLEKGQVDPYLDRYRLGDLWIQGQIGGVRW